MQQYLFRGKRKDNGDWVYGSLVRLKQQAFIIEPDTEVEYFPLFIEVISETIGMWTGWADKHGVKIFAGDTLRGMMGELDRDKSHYSPIVSAVEVKNGGYKVFSRPMSSAHGGDRIVSFNWCDVGYHGRPNKHREINDIEVIGNIYINPELFNPAQEQL
jgi:uncharacterized phage protein (TIGR01671 family)